MDRTSWIAIILSVIGLFAWQWYVAEYHTPPPRTAQAAAEQTPSSAPTPAQEAAPEPSPALPVSAITARAESLEGEGAEFIFNNDTGGIEQVVLQLHLGENQERISLNRSRLLPIGAIGFEPGRALGGFEMRTDRAKGQAVFDLAREDGLQITKRFQLPPKDDKKLIY